MPQMKMPQMKMPQMKMPEMKMPQMKMPEMKMPEMKMPEMKMPQMNRNAPAGGPSAQWAELAGYELEMLAAARRALHERVCVGRRAESFGELLMDQIDLLPADWLRLKAAQRGRAQRWRAVLSRA